MPLLIHGAALRTVPDVGKSEIGCCCYYIYLYHRDPNRHRCKRHDENWPRVCHLPDILLGPHEVEPAIWPPPQPGERPYRARRTALCCFCRMIAFVIWFLSLVNSEKCILLRSENALLITFPLILSECSSLQPC